MNNYLKAKYLIAEFSGQERTITVPKIYVEMVGDYTTAILLNQIVFYSDKSKRTDGFFYKTYKDWQEELMLTERQVRLSTNKLKDLKLVETKLKKADGSPTLHYKLDMDVLSDSILTLCQNRNSHNVRNETDIMSESLTVDNTVDNTVNNYSREELAVADQIKKDFENRKRKQNLNSFGQVIQCIERNLTMHIGYKEQQLAKMWLDENNDNAPLIIYAIERSKEKGKKAPFVDYLLKDWARQGISDPQKAKAVEEANDPANKAKKTASGYADYV